MHIEGMGMTIKWWHWVVVGLVGFAVLANVVSALDGLGNATRHVAAGRDARAEQAFMASCVKRDTRTMCARMWFHKQRRGD